uniref:RNA-directed RNA polymerase L n=1 Tax=South Bay virus TaxID=1526514 RepID=A0A076E6R2_9VIRU|nr:L protein [South Bay virus]
MAGRASQGIEVRFKGAIRGGCQGNDRAVTLGWERFTLDPEGPVGISSMQLLSWIVTGEKDPKPMTVESVITDAALQWWPEINLDCDTEVMVVADSMSDYLSRKPWEAQSVDLLTLALLCIHLDKGFELYRRKEMDECSMTSVCRDSQAKVKVMVSKDYLDNEMYQILVPVSEGSEAPSLPPVVPSFLQAAQELDEDVWEDAEEASEITDTRFAKGLQRYDSARGRALAQAVSGTGKRSATSKKKREKGRKVPATDMGFHSVPYPVRAHAEQRVTGAGPTGARPKTPKMQTFSPLDSSDFPILTESSESSYGTPDSDTASSYRDVAEYGLLSSSSDPGSQTVTPEDAESATIVTLDGVKSQSTESEGKRLTSYLLPRWARSKLGKLWSPKAKSKPDQAEGGKEAKAKKVQPRGPPLRVLYSKKSPEVQSSSDTHKGKPGGEDTSPTSKKKKKAMERAQKYEREAAEAARGQKKLRKRELRQETRDPRFYDRYIPVTGVAMLPTGIPLDLEDQAANTEHRRRLMGAGPRPSKSQLEEGPGESTSGLDFLGGRASSTPKRKKTTSLKSYFDERNGERKKASKPFIQKGMGKGGMKRGYLSQGEVYPMSHSGPPRGPPRGSPEARGPLVPVPLTPVESRTSAEPAVRSTARVEAPTTPLRQGRDQSVSEVNIIPTTGGVFGTPGPRFPAEQRVVVEGPDEEIPFGRMERHPQDDLPTSFVPRSFLIGAEQQQQIIGLVGFLEKVFSTSLWIKESRVSSLNYGETFCITDVHDVTIFSLRLDEFLVHLIGSQDSKSLRILATLGICISSKLALQSDVSLLGPLIFDGLVEERFWVYLPKPEIATCALSLLLIKLGDILEGDSCSSGADIKNLAAREMSDRVEVGVTILNRRNICSAEERPEESFTALFRLVHSDRLALLNRLLLQLDGSCLTRLDLMNPSVCGFNLCEHTIRTLIEDEARKADSEQYVQTISMDLMRLSYVVDQCMHTFELLNPGDGTRPCTLSSEAQTDLRIMTLEVIKEYFAEWSAGHEYVLVNPAMLESSIKCLAQHASRIASYREMEMTLDDYSVHKRLMTKLFKILEKIELMPMVEVCKQVKSAFDALITQLPDVVRREVKQLYNNLIFCNSYSDAWQYGMRIKGIAYEGFFSRRYNLVYCPELKKPTLGEIIKVSFPLQYSKFLTLSAKCPEVRMITPDFYIHRRSVFGPEKPQDLRTAIKKAFEESSMASATSSTPPSEDIAEESGTNEPAPSQYRIAPDDPRGQEKQFTGADPNTDLIRNLCVDAIALHGQLGKVIKESEVIAVHTTDEESPYASKAERVTSNECELIVIEVGYVTDPDQKVEIDMSKWAKAVKILQQLDISTTLIIATDVSSRSVDKWWITPANANLLKRSVGALFFHLIKHTPQDIKDRIVGGLTTLKYSLSRRAGSTIKTPVTVNDVKEYYSESKSKIEIRPTGTKLPTEIMKGIEESLVNGCAISEGGADKVIGMLKASAHNIIAQYIETENREELLDNETTKLKVLGGWLTQEYKNRTCDECFKLVSQNDLTRPGYIEELVYMINTSTEVKPCCLERINTLPCQGPLPLYLTRCPPLTSLTDFTRSHVQEVERTELDTFMGTTFPSRTPAQKKLKKTLDRLSRVVLDINGITAVKNSKGQIFLNSKFSSELSEKICVPKMVIKPNTSKSTIAKFKTLTDSIKEQLLIPELKSYSDYHKSVIQNLIDNAECQVDSQCSLHHTWVMRILESLRLTSTPSEVLLNMKDTIEKRKQNAPLNDSFRIPSKPEIICYLQSFKDRLLSSVGSIELYSLDCVLFKEVFDEAVKRLSCTPYTINLGMISNVTKLLLKLGWYQNLVLYSKICMLYLSACSEFTSSGVKVIKVPHTALNIVVKLSADKKTNSHCSLFDLDFNEVVPPFFLNRCVATIGQSMPYVLIVLLVQLVQNYKCLDALENLSCLNFNRIQDGVDQLHENFSRTVLNCYEGDYDSALDNFKSCWLTKTLHSNQSPGERLERLISSFTIGMGEILVPAMLLNSLNFNSQIQKMRFTTIMSLSLIGRPREMGEKMYSPCRRVEAFVAKLYLQLSSYSALSGIVTNPDAWKEDMFYPATTINSLSLYGMLTSGDRQLLTDIYLVHIYNKELDNFDEGSIAVLEELADRHFGWEHHVSRLVDETRDPGTSRRKVRQNHQELRLLLGVVKLDLPSANEKDQSTTEMDDSKSIRSQHSGSHRAASVVSSLRSWGRDTVYCLSETSELYPNMEQGGQLSLRQTELCTIYTPNMTKLQKDISTVLAINPSYTMGCPEILQAMTEYGKRKFPEVVIQKAKRDPRNWASIATVSESTAIVPGPLRVFDIRRTADTMKRMQGTKLKKLLKNRLSYLGGASKKEKTVKEISKDLEELLSCVDTVDPSVKEEIKKCVVEAHSLKQVTWQYAMKLPLEQTLLTIEGHNLFYWIKNLQKSVYKLWSHPEMLAITRNPIVVSILSVVKDVGQGQIPSISLEELIQMHTGMFKIWVQSLDICIGLLELDTVSMSDPIVCLKESYQQLHYAYKELLKLKKENPELSFKKQERELKQLECRLLSQHNSTISFYCNILFVACFSCPWFRSLKHQEGIMLKSILSEIGLSFNTEGMSTKYLKVLLPMMCTRQVVAYYFAGHLGDGSEGEFWMYDCLSRFCIAMFCSNTNPMSYVHTKKLSDINTNLDGVLQSTNELIALYALEGNDYDFSLTVTTLANSSQITAHKLTGRTKGERLPRSTRSKVIYEIIKLMGTSSTAILQEVVFDRILDVSHEFFATLAPKAQLGGNRDLFVQETSTKLIHAVTEVFSKTLLSQTSDDGLTNQHLKEEILSTAHSEFWHSTEQHGTVSDVESSSTEEGGYKINFYKVLSVAGDNTKWGPIHCCSYFSLMYQQLLLRHPDWKHFIMLVMLKDLNKEVEIPAASISKIMNSLLHDATFIQNTKGRTNPAQLQSELARMAKEWSWKPLVSDIILNYLVKGRLCLQCYNHMGQGIHHATSSVLTSLLAKLVEDILTSFIENELPGIRCKIVHAGSSDDYAKVITTYGVFDSAQFREYNDKWKFVMLDAKNLMSAICRLVQVKDSSKTLSSTIVAEFYSEFVFIYQKCPAPIKFTQTGLINSSVTSPVTMSQTCQVGSQQCMYNSVPQLTNLAFGIFRQQLYFNYIENFIRKYGKLVLGSVSSFARLYLPVYSNMIEAGLVVEDIEQVIASLNRVSGIAQQLPTADYDTVLPNGTKSIVDSAGETSSSDDGLTAGDSPEDRISRSRKHKKVTLPKDVEDLAEKIKVQLLAQYNNNYIGDCDKFSRQCYSGQLCRHLGQTGFSEMIGNFVTCQPLSIRSRCLAPVADSRFDVAIINGQTYSLSLITQVMTDILNTVIFSYYKKPQTLNLSRKLKASYNREESSFFEDPFIQVKPNSLDREMKNLREAREDIKSITASEDTANNFPEFIADQLVKLNNMTEDYMGESERLMQAITSRSIIWGLAGGLKELSIPIYSIFFKAYFFIDHTGICTANRWVISRNEGHLDSSGKQLANKLRTKFSHWIDQVFDCVLHSEVLSSCPVLDDKARACKFVQVVQTTELGETNLNYIALDGKLCSKYANELTDLVLQFSDHNRLKVKVLESSQEIQVLPADMVHISKVRLFSRGAAARELNNPAVVIAYRLCPEAVYRLKPRGINYSTLEQDGSYIEDLHPAIKSEILKIISMHSSGEAFNLEIAVEKIKTITTLCRLSSSSRFNITSFYAIRPTVSQDETNISEIISYGIQEGKQVRIQQQTIDYSTYSERYYIILEAISMINHLPYEDEIKSRLMQNFLTWVPSVEGMLSTTSCGFRDFYDSLIALFGSTTLADTLDMEQHAARKYIDKRSCSFLSLFALNPQALQSLVPYTGGRIVFETRGDQLTCGNFTMSSADGNAIGVFRGGKLYIHIDKESPILVTEMVRRILIWITNQEHKELDFHSFEQFLKLLPTCRRGVIVNHEDDGSLLLLSPGSERPMTVSPSKGFRKGAAYIRLKPYILNYPIEKRQTHQPINCAWMPDKLVLYYSLVVQEMHPSGSIIKSLEILRSAGLNSEYQLLRQENEQSTRRVVVATVPLHRDINLRSAALLHLFLNHLSGLKAHSLGIPAQEAVLHKLVTQTSIDQLHSLLRRMKLQDTKSIELITDTQLRPETQGYACTPEPAIRERLNAILKDYRSATDWVAIQKIIDFFNMDNSIVINDDLELRGNVNWKVVSTSLSVIDPYTQFGHLSYSLISLVSLRCTPLLCRLALVEDNVSELREVAGDIRQILQFESLKDTDLHCLMVAACIFNRGLIRGKHGVLTNNEILRSILPLRVRGPRNCMIEISTCQGVHYLKIILTPIRSSTENKQERKQEIQVNIKAIASLLFKNKPSTTFKKICSGHYDNQIIGKVTYELMLIPLAVETDFHRLCDFLLPKYTRMLGKALACYLLSLLLDAPLEDAQCISLLKQYHSLSKGVIYPKKLPIAGSEGSSEEIDLLDLLGDDEEPNDGERDPADQAPQPYVTGSALREALKAIDFVKKFDEIHEGED